MTNNLIAITGPTASGKTGFAVALAAKLDGEILSADSRQVYRRMDIGTGKDLAEYTLNGLPIPHHLIDIVEPGTKYNLFEYQKDFRTAYTQIIARGKQAILCGGSGLYVDAVTQAYRLLEVPANDTLRAELEQWTDEALADKLASYGPLHNHTDTESRKRVIRAIEIADYQAAHPTENLEMPKFDTLFLGVDIDRNNRRAKITQRLKQRLDEGMIDEVQALLREGIAADDLIYYGLEYKFVTEYLTGQCSYNDMYQRLNTAIHQFAKRQMTWFRGMERRGVKIHWLSAQWPEERRLQTALDLIAQWRKDTPNN